MFGFLAQIFKQNSNVAELLELAAKKKKENISEAIELLKKAYKESIKSDGGYCIDMYLKLPMYLQKANRPDEAIAEFENLLKNGYPYQTKDITLIPMEHAQIYDKMRLFWQREKQFAKAVNYGLYSILLSALGLYRQKRFKELKTMENKVFITEKIAPLFKKIKREDLISSSADILINKLQELPHLCSFCEIEEMFSIKTK